MFKFSVFCIALFFVIFVADIFATAEPHVFNAVFGSCNKPDIYSQDFWPRIHKTATGDENDTKNNRKEKMLDAYITLGDTVYNDYVWPFIPFFTPNLTGTTQQRWINARNEKFYSEFAGKTRFALGTMDDHEVINDGGKEVKAGFAEQQQYLLDFLDVPRDAANVRRRRDGVYSFQKVPFSSSSSAKSDLGVCFILLDARSHRDPPRHDGAGDMLGEEQWKWLDAVLKTGADPDEEKHSNNNNNNNKNDVGGAKMKNVKSIDDVCVVTFIGSGVQVLQDAHAGEGWSEYPHARNRLLRLLLRSGARRFVFLSGDVHFASFDALRAAPAMPPVVGLPPRGATALGRFFIMNFFATTHKPGATAHHRYGSSRREQAEEKVLYESCPESPFAAYNQDLLEATSSGLSHSIQTQQGKIFDDHNFEVIFPSHRRLANNNNNKINNNNKNNNENDEDDEKKNNNSPRVFLRRNFGVIRVKCDKLADPDTCRTFLSLHSVETGAKVFSTEARFARKAAVADPDRFIPAGCPRPTAKDYELASYGSFLVDFVMTAKRVLPWLHEANRLAATIQALVLIIVATSIVGVLLVIYIVKATTFFWKFSKKKQD